MYLGSSDLWCDSSASKLTGWSGTERLNGLVVVGHKWDDFRGHGLKMVYAEHENGQRVKNAY